MSLQKNLRKGLVGVGAGALTAVLTCFPIGGAAVASAQAVSTATPIQHLVVIFQENESFDHYFATYPYATNPAGEDAFSAAAGTPSVDGLCTGGANPTVSSPVCTAALAASSTLLSSSNPNGAAPVRFDPGPNAGGTYNGTLDAHGSNAGIDNILTCSQNHSYMPEQTAFDGGLMDKFPASVGRTSAVPEPGEPACTLNENLDYYDGNTVTAYWNYAQHFAMSDNNYSTTFGPSTPGAINVVSGDTGNVGVSTGALSGNSAVVGDGAGGFSDIGDSDPFYDDCSVTSQNIGMSGKNIGDELNAAALSWGFFQGGFAPTSAYSGPANSAANPYVQSTVTGRAVCGAAHNVGAALGGTGTAGAQPYKTTNDYIQHHQPFQYYADTANPHHLAPTGLGAIGTDTQHFSSGTYGVGTPLFDTANHQYDTSNFDQLVQSIAQGSTPASALPAVSYLKAPAYEDEHPGNSDPVDGQHFVTQEVNALMQTPDWASTAVVVTYDDSDGWYDHVWSGAQNGNQPQNSSQTAQDVLTGTGACGTGSSPLAGEQGRCGFGPRMPFIVISPYAKVNFVNHDLMDQASLVNFIEYNWGLPAITGSADRLLTNTTSATGTPPRVYDMQNFFDFTPGASDVAGVAPYYLDPTTFQATSTPIPLVPETHFPVFFLVSGIVVLGGAALVLGRRQLHHRGAKA